MILFKFYILVVDLYDMIKCRLINIYIYIYIYIHIFIIILYML